MICYAFKKQSTCIGSMLLPAISHALRNKNAASRYTFQQETYDYLLHVLLQYLFAKTETEAYKKGCPVSSKTKDVTAEIIGEIRGLTDAVAKA